MCHPMPHLCQALMPCLQNKMHAEQYKNESLFIVLSLVPYIWLHQLRPTVCLKRRVREVRGCFWMLLGWGEVLLRGGEIDKYPWFNIWLKFLSQSCVLQCVSKWLLVTHCPMYFIGQFLIASTAMCDECTQIRIELCFMKDLFHRKFALGNGQFG